MKLERRIALCKRRVAILALSCLSLELLPSCLGTSKHGRAERATLLLYGIKRTSGSGNLFERLGGFHDRTGGLK